VRGQRAELHRRHLRGEPAGRDRRRRVITWFQAQAACENAGKRLPSNAEWQAAVAARRIRGGRRHDRVQYGERVQGDRHRIPHGLRVGAGAFDMVGNVYEWVADWVPGSTTCGSWSPSVSPTDDDQCLAGPGVTGEPSALLRGGNFFSGALAGPHAVHRQPTQCPA
jgi:formylglycine-generating enzyme required for sulfatase activity